LRHDRFLCPKLTPRIEKWLTVKLTPTEELKKQFDDFLHRRKDEGKVVDEIASTFRARGWKVFAFGGTPRGVYDSGKNYTPRDLDLVFDDNDFESFESAYERYILRKNTFGGLKLKIENIVIDAWPLSATWAFRNGYVKNPSFKNLPATTFLNIDGIIIEFAPKILKQRQVFELGFFEGWNSKTIDINLKRNPFPAICIARTLVISRHFGFYISTNLAIYLWDMLGRISLSAIEGAQKKHYGHIKFDFRELRAIRLKINGYLKSESIKPLALFDTRPVQADLFDSLKASSCWTCDGLSKEIRDYIASEGDEVEESFISSLFSDAFNTISSMKQGIANRRNPQKKLFR
jgi:hypothetical protein